MEHKLPELPYPKDALKPHISAETLEYHHGKHHKAYVTKLNELIKGTRYENMPLEEIVKTSEAGIFNNSAQAWNHTFFWNCLSPKGGGLPKGKIGEIITKKWGSYDKFKDEFSKAAIDTFGSGWTWLVQNKQGDVEIFTTANAETPMTSGLKALMTIDVWEHAYYIDYRNVRPDFVNAYWKLINWEFVNKNLN
ncbi:MAG TPA: Fe-Mn family superoxide dismutase [Bacteriovoracaceae bacterium]|nr:Fe-Mn family superoxide dismutase [Bacteriovoracaceae bacterium]